MIATTTDLELRCRGTFSFRADGAWTPGPALKRGRELLRFLFSSLHNIRPRTFTTFHISIFIFIRSTKQPEWQSPAVAPTPVPNLVPAGFRTNGATVPMMGMHYISADQPEFHGGTFTATPIYGYSNGHFAFVESMITLDYRHSHPALSSALPQPARFERSGVYPTQWTAKYDAAAHRYDIAFSGLASR